MIGHSCPSLALRRRRLRLGLEGHFARRARPRASRVEGPAGACSSSNCAGPSLLGQRSFGACHPAPLPASVGGLGSGRWAALASSREVREALLRGLGPAGARERAWGGREVVGPPSASGRPPREKSLPLLAQAPRHPAPSARVSAPARRSSSRRALRRRRRRARVARPPAGRGRRRQDPGAPRRRRSYPALAHAPLEPGASTSARGLAPPAGEAGPSTSRELRAGRGCAGRRGGGRGQGRGATGLGAEGGGGSWGRGAGRSGGG